MDAGSCVSPRRGERPCLAGREVAEPNPRSLPLKGRDVRAECPASPRIGEKGPAYRVERLPEPNPRSLPLKGREAVAWMQVLKSPRIGEKGPAWRVERFRNLTLGPFP